VLPTVSGKAKKGFLASDKVREKDRQRLKNNKSLEDQAVTTVNSGRKTFEEEKEGKKDGTCQQMSRKRILGSKFIINSKTVKVL